MRNNVFWMFAGNGFYALMQWLQLSIISKGCPALTLGTFTLSLAVSAPVFQFLGLQLRNVMVTDSRSENTFPEFFALRLWTMLLSLGIVIVFGIAGKMGISILAPVAGIKFIEGIAEMFNGQQQKQERMQYLALSISLKGITGTIGVFAGVYWLGSLPAGLMLALAGNILVLFFNDYLNCRRLMVGGRFISFKGLRLKPLLLKSLPLGVVMLIISLNANVSKYAVEHFLGTEMQGIYSTVAYCLVLGTFVSNAVGQSFSPRLSRYYAEGMRSSFTRLAGIFTGFNFLAGAGLFLFAVIFGEWFLRVMFNEAIAAYSHLFAIVMLGGMISNVATALGYTLTSMRVFQIQPLINGAELAVNMICCYFMVLKFGLYGAAYASLVAPFIRLVLTFITISRNYGKGS